MIVQTFFEDKTKANGKIITQTVRRKRPSQFTDSLHDSALTYRTCRSCARARSSCDGLLPPLRLHSLSVLFPK